MDGMCFNPCCIGFSVATALAIVFRGRLSSFNPCCIGFSVATVCSNIALLVKLLVSILVVLDLALQHAGVDADTIIVSFVSILVVLDLALQQ